MYPKRFVDNLGREVRLEISSAERVYRTFWGTTKNIKVRYHLFNKDVKIDVYDQLGNTIMTNESGAFKITLKNFNIVKNRIYFRVNSELINKWKNLLN